MNCTQINLSCSRRSFHSLNTHHSIFKKDANLFRIRIAHSSHLIKTDLRRKALSQQEYESAQNITAASLVIYTFISNFFTDRKIDREIKALRERNNKELNEYRVEQKIFFDELKNILKK